MKFRKNHSVFYQHWLFAPEGYIFDLDAIKRANVFCEDEELTVKGNVLLWVNLHQNFYADIPDVFYERHLTVENGCIIKMEEV